jgi:hypothetical protein
LEIYLEFCKKKGKTGVPVARKMVHIAKRKHKNEREESRPKGKRILDYPNVPGTLD